MKKFIKSFLITLGVIVFVLAAGFGITYAVDKDFALDLLDKIGIQIEQPVEQPDDETPGGDIEVPGEDTGETEEPENPDDSEEPDDTETYICNVSDYEFDGNTITAYNGDDKYIQIPSSYSISGTEMVKMTFDEMEFQDYLILNFEDITYPITITDANSQQYILNSEMDVFENQDIVYPVSLEVEKTIYVEGDDYSVTSIDNNAFQACNNILSITIPASVTSIGNWAFSECSSLTGVDFGENSQLTSIGNYAFMHSSDLISITLPSSVTSIGNRAFDNCSNIETITVKSGNSVYHSNSNCLIETESKILVLGCKTSVIPNDGSVTSIGNYAFMNCSDLTSITLPSSVTSIGEWAFRVCSNIESITVESGNSVYHSNGNCLIETESKTLLLGCKTSIIPNDGSVTSIGEDAFIYCSLTSITIPDSVTSIGAQAFSECRDLTSITIPASVTNIGTNAFANCDSLTSVEFQGQVPDIQTFMFHYCDFIAKYDFSNCKTIPLLEKVSGLDYADGCKIIIPDALYDEWTTATNWSSLTNVVWVKASEATNA